MPQIREIPNTEKDIAVPQNLIQLPKNAEIQILGWGIGIRNHAMISPFTLIESVIGIIQDVRSDWQSLCQLEKHGINFETAIECCIDELENRTDPLEHIISNYYNICEFKDDENVDVDNLVEFSKVEAFRAATCQLVEKIRSCDDWQQLYEELHTSSTFQKGMKTRIIANMREQCHKV